MEESRPPRRRNAHINNTLNRIIQTLRTAGREMTLTEIEGRLNTSLTTNDDILSYIKSDDKKIHYDPGRELFSLKTSYPTIINKTSFMEYFVKAVQGIQEDNDLRDCYSGIMEDIDELKKANKVRSIYN